jgi:hypothetical protein
MESFLDAADRLVRSYREQPRFSLLGCLSERIAALQENRLSFRVVVPRRRYRLDWPDFLGSCPCLKDHGAQGIESHLINAEQLHASSQPVHCLIHAGMVWERLAGSLHQALVAPGWETFLHVQMQGTAVHPSFPDFLTTLPWEKEVEREGLFQNLSGLKDSERTGLVRFHREEVSWGGPELAAISEAGPPTEVSPDNDILPDDWGEEDRDKAAHYSGLAFRISTRSCHVFHQPLYNDGSRGGVAFLRRQTGQLTRTSLVVPGMLALVTAQLKGKAMGPGGVDAGQWKQALREVLRQKTEASVTRELRGQIRLKNLRQALRRWARRSLLDAPRSKRHFLALWTYLHLPDDQMVPAWKEIVRERSNARKRGHDWSVRKNRQIRRVLADRLEKVRDVAALAQEQGGDDVYRDDRVRVFISEVEQVASEPIKRPFSRCNLAYRIRQE